MLRARPARPPFILPTSHSLPLTLASALTARVSTLLPIGCFVIDGAASGVTKTPSTRKRKLDNTTVTTTPSQDSQPARKASKTTHKDVEQVEAALPATPQTLGSDKPMDSDDDFNSIVSSDDIGGDDDSSVDLGAGMLFLSALTYRAAPGCTRALLSFSLGRRWLSLHLISLEV